MVYSRMAVNSAIERLINQDDESGESARIVISFGSTLRKAGFVTADIHTHNKKDKTGMKGYSPGWGNVSVSENEEEPEVAERNIGYTKERVGWYRLWKSSDGVLRFHHFWKSSLVTRSGAEEALDEYCLVYDLQTLEPIFFAIKRKVVSLRIGFLYFYYSYLEPIYGEIKKPSKFRTIGFGLGSGP